MRIAGRVQDSIVDGPGFRFTLFVQGCSHHCPGCHNDQTHDPLLGEDLAPQTLIDEMGSNPLTDGLTLSGGEPMEQAQDCLTLAQAAHQAGLNVWCYTGYTFEHLFSQGTAAQKALLAEVDVLIDGPFLLKQRSLSLPWRGSSNQRILDAKQSLAVGQAVEMA